MTDPRPEDLERALRQALRPVEPPAGFDARVMQATDASRSVREHRLEPRVRWLAALVDYLRRPARREPRWALASVSAAVVALAAAGGLAYREHVQALRAEQTRAEVAEAMRIANDKLDTAFRLVAEETRSESDRQLN